MSKDYDKVCQFVFVCKGSDCKKKGGKQLLKSFNKTLKSTNRSKSAVVIETKCMNRCKEAPTVVVGQKWLTKVKEGEVKSIIEDYLK